MNAKHILVVDDSRTSRAVLTEAISQLGCAVSVAASGAEALAAIDGTSFDLVTLDIELPDMSGYEVCSKIRELTADDAATRLPIIFITSQDTIEGRLRGFEAGGTAFVLKSDGTNAITKEVEHFLAPTLDFSERKVLIATEGRLLGKMVEEIIRSLGPQTVLVHGGDEAYKALQAEGKNFDLAVFDYLMSGLDGVHLLQRIRTELRLTELATLLLSSQKEARMAFFRAGASDYLEKPFLREELLARVRVQLERHTYLSKMRAMVQELERSNKVLSDFAYVAAHDLKAPLASVSFAVDMLKGSVTQNDDTGILLPIIASGIGRMCALVDNLLAYSKLQSKELLEFEPVSLQEVIQDVLADLLAKIRDSKAIISVNELPTVLGNKALLRQLFQNLIGNALKYQPQGNIPKIIVLSEENTPVLQGGLKKNSVGERLQTSPQQTIKTPPLREGSSRITSSSAEVDSHCRIAICDNGIGFKQEEAQKIFGLFTRLVAQSGEYEGSGIGLATCKRIVDLHNGRIWATSQPDVGSRFEVELPRPSPESSECSA